MNKINNIDKPDNVKVNVGGATDDINQAMTQLAFAMLVGIVKGAKPPLNVMTNTKYTITIATNMANAN
jgi:hypothetical protein